VILRREAPLIGNALVDAAHYQTFLILGEPADSPNGMVSLIPGVAGTDELPAIPERVIPFQGHVVTAGVAIREMNMVAGEGDEQVIQGICRFQITLNAVVVYRPELRYARTLRDALMEVYGYLQKLQAHEVRWWDMSSWQERPVWYQGAAATIVGFTPESGQAWLEPVEGEVFPPLAAAREVLGHAGARTGVAVDILNPEVIWTRRAEVRPPEPPQEQEEAPT